MSLHTLRASTTKTIIVASLISIVKLLFSPSSASSLKYSYYPNASTSSSHCPMPNTSLQIPLPLTPYPIITLKESSAGCSWSRCWRLGMGTRTTPSSRNGSTTYGRQSKWATHPACYRQSIWASYPAWYRCAKKKKLVFAWWAGRSTTVPAGLRRASYIVKEGTWERGYLWKQCERPSTEVPVYSTIIIIMIIIIMTILQFPTRRLDCTPAWSDLMM